MSGFLSRWARLKAAARETPAPLADAPIDEASLPKLEEITGASDIRAFLASGVSAALQSRALRIAWEQDATIASFRGMAEYDWDFNAAGYGRLAVGDDVAALLRGVMDTVTPARDIPARDIRDARSNPSPIPSHKGRREESVAAVAQDTPPPLVGGGWGEGAGSEIMLVETAPDQCVAAPLPPAVDPLLGSTPQGEGERKRRRHGGALPT
jgi:hypothetical protein